MQTGGQLSANGRGAVSPRRSSKTRKRVQQAERG
jgi:hypothetical protein